ncbi:helix-turn-helix domain-containing protein [Cellulomonas iranensis]|uniref:helix-turn-helix domain-containing protein n=1 Tax=Cellulomonas iranensis TaxID=76862 RepID=UPI000B3BE618|nr:helix-turn-helix domain-containing protein [Cellulomonas iranensis]
MTYNARIDLARPAPDSGDDDWTDRVLDHLVGFGPVVSRGMHGGTTLDVTIPAADVRQAVTVALALTADATGGAQVVGIEVLTTAEFDRRNGLAPVPDLLSVTEAAETLGVSRQAVLQRLELGTLPGTKVGTTWAIPTSAVEALRSSEAGLRAHRAAGDRVEDVARRTPQP